jgi:hypothetical protein
MITAEISHLAAACYFVLSAGAAWILCEGGSGVGTDRWGRNIYLVPAVLAWLLFWGWLGNSFAGAGRMPDAAGYNIAAGLGIPFGTFAYWVYRRYIAPRARGPNENGRSRTLYLSSRPKSWLRRLVCRAHR